MSPLAAFCLIAFVVGALGDANNDTLPDLDPDFFEQVALWEGRIVGGRDAQPGQFPHQVSYRLPNGHHFCGGSVLSEYFTLSAAHCFQRQTSQRGNVRVAVGSHRRINDGIIHEVAAIFNHPQYNPNILANDIAVVRVATPIQLNSRNIRHIRPSGRALPEAGNLPVAISGWGQTDHNPRPGVVQPVPEVLQYKVTSTLNRAACIRALGNQGRLVHPNTVCTQNPPRRGACMGDSGGPLITQDGLQVGVVSWGIPCGRGFPDVYACVFSHGAWIRHVTGL